MRPDPETNNAFVYCLAVASQKYDMKVIFTSAMSNHHHTGVIDEKGNLPGFLAYFHRLFAKHQNSLRGRWEAFWASEQTSAVELVDAEDVLEKMVYALTNPVKDHLVETVGEWPGVNSLSALLTNTPLSATRPSRFFRPDGEMPPSAVLSFHLPQAVRVLVSNDLARALKQRVTETELRSRAALKASGRRFMGQRGVCRQNWSDSPYSNRSPNNGNPRVACANAWRRGETLQRNRVWLAEYREARENLRNRVEVPFPHGTFWLHRFAGVACAPPIPVGPLD